MTHTIGIVVTIPQPAGDHLRHKRRSYGDPEADIVPPHITLLPPTVVPSDRYDLVLAHVRAVAAATRPFEVMLNSTGTFRPVSPVVFVQVAQGIPECERLESALRSGPVRRDLDFPYHPHVTIAHRLDSSALDLAFADLAEFSTRFLVRSIDVYEHCGDRWQLRAAAELAAAPEVRP
ncbi:MAG: 2'-5' RNA ligase family protein [Nostocoides sp.]